MKIEIDIDIETIIKAALNGEAVTKMPTAAVFGKEAVDNVAAAVKKQVENIEWEFGPKPGRRRSKEEISLHELELKHGRLLTPEEKGEGKAAVEIEDTKEAKAKEAAIKKDRIDQIAKEGMDAASEELAQETPAEPEAEIPKAEEIKTLDSMFK